MNDKPDGMAMKGVPRVDDWHMTDLLHAEQGRGDPFAAAIRATRMPMIITDPRRNDNPIVFANEAFLRLTGYDRAEVLGRNCRFLQGADSDRDVIHRIREAISKRQDVQVEIINYRKDGFPFWNSLFISPVTNDAGDLHFYFASQFDLTSQRSEIARINSEKARVERAVQERTTELQAALEAQKTLLHEVDHRVKNNLQMVSSLIAMQTRSMSDGRAKASLQSTLARIEALSTVHRRLYQSKDVGHFDVAEFLRDLVTDLVTGTGRTDVAVECQLDTVVIPADQATPIALMVNELVTNALKYAFGDPASAPREGRLFVSLRNVDEGFAMSVADDGPGMPILTSQSSFGTKLIAALARQLHAEIAWTNREPGTRVTITVPVSEQVGGPVVEPND